MENKRRILITGGTGRIGSVLVKRMLADGHRVVFTSTNSEKAKNFEGDLAVFRDRVSSMVLRLEDSFDISSWAKRLPFQIDTIIHNARNLDTLKIEKDGYTSAVNLVEEFKVAVVFPYMINQAIIKLDHPLRDVIFISSMYGVVAPNTNLYDDLHRESAIQYGTGKAAQIHIARELAVRFAEKSIRVNAISYGGVEGRASAQFVEKYKDLTPSGKMLNDDDLYPPVQYIINNPLLNVTGENIKVDGGWTIW